MYEIKIKLIKLIAIFEYLIQIENFSAYNSILKSYNKVLEGIKDKSKEDLIERDFEPLMNVFRLFFEAIPSDNSLATYIPNKMQEFYELQERIIAKNTI